MDEKTQKKVTSIVGLVLALISRGPAARGLEDLHSNPMGTGLWLGVFIAGIVLGFSVFMKTPATPGAKPLKQVKPMKQVRQLIQSQKAANPSSELRWWHIVLMLVGAYVIFKLFSIILSAAP